VFPPKPLLLAALALALLASPTLARAEGGAAAPPASGGGAIYGQGAPSTEEPAANPPARHKRRHKHSRRKRSHGAPLLTGFRLARPQLFLFGHTARVDYRIESRLPTVRVRLYVLRPGVHQPASTIYLGSRSTGSRQSYALTGLENGVLPQGHYVLRIAARDSRGRRLRRAASASSTSELDFFHHRHPLVGVFTYGGKDARFGAKRRGHTHQGQDMPAAEGTPIVAPRGGVIQAVEYQRSGAGNYAVLKGEGENRSYVFMHMRTGSVVVREGQRVRTGQRIGEVGTTGESSGPHLHFEIWVGAWQSGGRPIDPLPLLRAWDSWS
jgi:murein DD-endopeptidase MepM/ murein hydrolase activator NlpD